MPGCASLHTGTLIGFCVQPDRCQDRWTAAAALWAPQHPPQEGNRARCINPRTKNNIGPKDLDSRVERMLLALSAPGSLRLSLRARVLVSWSFDVQYFGIDTRVCRETQIVRATQPQALRGGFISVLIAFRKFDPPVSKHRRCWDSGASMN